MFFFKIFFKAFLLHFLKELNFSSLGQAFLVEAILGGIGTVYRIGLHGQSIIPIASGLGCNVPAILDKKGTFPFYYGFTSL